MLQRNSLFAIILCCLTGVVVDGQIKRGSASNDPRWKPICTTDHEKITYDSRSVRRTPEETVIAWVQFKYTPAGILAVIKSRAKEKLSIQGYEGLDSTLNRYEFDCAKRTARALASVDYLADGTTLDNDEFGADKDAWRPIVPGTVMEFSLNTICKTAKPK